MLMRHMFPVFVCLLVSTQCSNGLFENIRAQDGSRMAAVTRWRRSAGRVEPAAEESRAVAMTRRELATEIAENRGMMLKTTEHHVAGTRRRYAAQLQAHHQHYGAHRGDSRRHAIHSHTAPTTTTTTATTSTTTSTATTTQTTTTVAPPTTTTTPTTTPPTTTSTTTSPPTTNVPPATPSAATTPATSPSTTPFPLITNNPPPNTMSETMDSYFRPIDLNVPRDHLRPFQEFGKKLSRGHAPSTTINTNTLEVTTNKPRYLNSNLKNRSNLEDELDEDMDVGYSKPFTEQNKASGPHHIMFIMHGARRPQPSSTASTEQGGGDTGKPQVSSTASTEQGGGDARSPQPSSTASVEEGGGDLVDATTIRRIMEELTTVTSDLRAALNVSGSVAPASPTSGSEGEKGNATLSKEFMRVEGKESVIQLVGVLKTASDPLVTLAAIDEAIATTLASVKEAGDRETPPKFVAPGSRNGTSFVLLPRRRGSGLVYGTKKNVTTTGKQKQTPLDEVKVRDEKQGGGSGVATLGLPMLRRYDENVRAESFENYSKVPRPPATGRSEKATESQSNDQQVENTITKHVRGNVTYKSQLLKSSRTPKTLQYAPGVVSIAHKQEQLRQTPVQDATTFQSPERENLTSKILSTAVVTSISVLGEWTPMIPFLQTDAGENTTKTAPDVATPLNATRGPDVTTPPASLANVNDSLSTDAGETPAIQTKESMRVSYSRNVPKYPISNSTSLYLSPNQSTVILEMIKNLTSTQHTTEAVFAEGDRTPVVTGTDTGPGGPGEGVEPLGHNSEAEGTTDKEAPKTTETSVAETGEAQDVNARESKHTRFNGTEETNTKEKEQTIDLKTEVHRTTTGATRLQDTLAESVTSLVPGEETTTVTSTTPDVVVTTEESSSPGSPAIQRAHDGESETTSPLSVSATGASADVGDAGPAPAEVTTVGGVRVSSTQVVVNATSVPVTAFSSDSSKAAEEESSEPPTPTTTSLMTPTTTRSLRVVRIGEKEKTRVIYHTEEEEVSSKPGQEGTPDNDVATYILGTFGLIPIAIAVLLSVKYCISRRKKIWESEKSPLTFVTTNEWEFPRSKLRLQTVLGQGNFGQVYKAEADDILGERATRLVAVKTIKDGGSSQEKEDLMRELAILKQIGAHSNVVTLLGCCTEKEPYYLILEYVMYGKLLSFLRDNRTRRQYYNFSEETAELTAKDLTSFAYCVARGMEYLTSKGIIHRDLAARNILVDHNKICKVADFGMSRSVAEPGEIYEQTRPKGALPIRWMAPESLLYRVFTHKSDVWAFGILMWEIVTLGSTPYQNMSAREVIKQVRDGYRLERPDHCRPELYRVAARCWSHDPSKRPTFGEVKMELADLLEQGEPQTYVDLDSYIESISGSNTRSRQQTTHVVNL